MAKPSIQLLDLRPISRSSDLCEVTVTLENIQHLRNFLWIRAGQADLRLERRQWLNVRGPDGVTDSEHDSVHILSLPLIGVTMQHVFSHNVTISAYIDPSEVQDFRVPPPDYDPTKHPEAYTCKDPRCERPHIISPRCYQAPVNPDLFEIVRGKKVEIVFGPVFREVQ